MWVNQPVLIRKIREIRNTMELKLGVCGRTGIIYD